MASNATPRNRDELIALAEDIADGLQTLETPLSIKQNTEEAVRADLTALAGRPEIPADPGPPAVPAQPAIPGAQLLYQQAQQNTAAAKTALAEAFTAARDYLQQVRGYLSSLLGTRWNAKWIPTGFPNNSTSVPGKQDDCLALLGALRAYFQANPDKQVNTPELVITAAALQTRHTAFSDLRAAANNAGSAQRTARDVDEAAEDALRSRVSGAIDEIGRKLGPDDARWDSFGLNRPGDPDLPEPVESLTLAPAGAGKLHATWPRARRARRYRLFIQIVGTDPDFHALTPSHAGSGGTLEKTLEGLPSGATVKLKIVAANDAGEAAASPVAEAVVA